jgi:hypothetical protein
MTIQNFNIYTAKGYAGELVDSGPRVVQTGILTDADLDFGVALKRDTSIAKGVAKGAANGKIFAISQREYNHEASTRPSDGTTKYLESESVSIIRQGYLYIKLDGSTSITAGEVLHVDNATGVFSKDSVAGNVIATENVVADEDGVAGDIIKVRLDIVS